MAAHVALGKAMLARPQQFLERLMPVDHRLVIHFHNYMADDRGAHALVGEGEMNIRLVAGIEFEDRPHRRAHLLSLHVSGISGDTQSTEPNKGGDDCVIWASACLFWVFRHDPTLVLSRQFPSR